MNYTPLFIHSYYSVGRGLPSPKEIVKYCKNLDMTACALTDINNIAGCIEFYKEAKKEKIKPIIGCHIMTEQGSLLLYALNKNGYNDLLSITAELNSGKDYIELKTLIGFNLSNLACIVGHEDSCLYRLLVSNYQIRDNKKEASFLLQSLDFLFNNLYIELQFSECDKLSYELKSEYIDLSINNKIDCILCPRSYYLDKEDKELHKILLSVAENESLDDLNQINGKLYKFFDGYKFYLPSYNEVFQENQTQSWTQDRSYSWVHIDPIYGKAIENTNKLAEMVEDYNLAKPASLPKFNCPKKKTSEEYFRGLCTEGFSRKINKRVQKELLELYSKRVETEITVLKDANLFDYFLILRDIIEYAKSKDYLVGPGRGSVAGCLVAYLLDIHQIDSIKYDLIFERFFNKGRVGSLPDIDTDFEKEARDDIIKYVIKKYGKENVMQIATYSTLMGRHALKAVFRANKSISFSEQNEITKNIVDKAKISDELQEMEEPSVIRWCLENKSNELSPWCSIDSDGVLQGPLSKEFEQAIKLEGVICNESKHAAGVVIGPEPLRNLVPIIYDKKGKQQIIGCQMSELEYVGLVKLDILSLSTLSRLRDVNKI